MMPIVMLPFAGGNKNSYQEIARYIPGMHTLEYPGRGSRIREPLPVTLDLLVDDITLQLKKTIDISKKYIIYGHSMGALLAYLVCRKVHMQGWPMPEKLIVSGRKAPHLKRRRYLAGLPDDHFMKEVTALGGIPDEVIRHPELMEYIMPILKADFRVYESYKYVQAGKLPVPIDVFYGDEEGIAPEDIAGWKDESLKTVNIREMKGNHFFIFDHVDYFSSYFRSQSIHYSLTGESYS